MNWGPLRLCVLCLAPLFLAGAAATVQPANDQGRAIAEPKVRDGNGAKQDALRVEYLEIVTPSVNETCDALAQAHGVVFGEPIAALGNARTANLSNGGRIGVRAPMHGAEKPVVRPYVLVEDIEGAVEAAVKAGAQVAVPPMTIPGQGTIAIYVFGGIEHGLWRH